MAMHQRGLAWPSSIRNPRKKQPRARPLIDEASTSAQGIEPSTSSPHPRAATVAPSVVGPQAAPNVARWKPRPGRLKRPRHSPTPPPLGAAPAPFAWGLQVVVETAPGQVHHLTREWQRLVREDPELWALHRRGSSDDPGIILTSIGGLWFSVSAAIQADTPHDALDPSDPGAVEIMFRWVYRCPVGRGDPHDHHRGKARRALADRQRQLYITGWPRPT